MDNSITLKRNLIRLMNENGVNQAELAKKDETGGGINK